MRRGVVHVPSHAEVAPPVEDLEVVTRKLFRHCEKRDWAGHDPYDALNCPIFELLPFLNSRVPRLLLTQLLKKSPVNVRPLLRIAETHNPKSLALFLTAIIKLKRIRFLSEGDSINTITKNLVALRARDSGYWCWGYSFPWQTRTVLVARGAPNLVCTVFVADALLDLYEQGYGDEHLSMAKSAAEYILEELFWSEGAVAGFAYPTPDSKYRVHNANFLGAALLDRVFRHSGDRRFLEAAQQAGRYSAGRQRSDGSWYYGESDSQKWIDNFHTGFCLRALNRLCKSPEWEDMRPVLKKGFAFYREHFFGDDNKPRYFHDREYPLDTHCAADSIITLLELEHLDPSNRSIAADAYRWAMEKLWNPEGYFYYQAGRFVTNRICYVRWSQAWMLVALSLLLEVAAARG